MIIGGIVLVAVAAVLLLVSASQKRRLAAMRGTQTSLASDLKGLASSVGKEIGGGSFAEAAEVKGLVRCEHPLASELAEVPCVHYSMKVSREYEETVWEKDSNGNQTQRTQRGSEVVSQNARAVLFEVEDSSGRITVDPEGAEFVSERVLSQFEPGETQTEGFRMGRFTLRLPGMPGGRRTLGYRYEEHAIPVDREIYVLGEAGDAGGSLRIRRPTAKGGRFIVSLRSEEELARGAGQTATVLRIIAIVAVAAGAALVVAGVLL